MQSDLRSQAVGYWALGIVIAVVGSIDLAGIGALLFVPGMAMLIFGRWRHDQTVFIPGLASTITFVAGFWLIAPWRCSRGSGMDARTVCHHAFGIRVYGDESLWPALVVAILGASGTWFLARWIIRRRSHQGAPSHT